MAFYAANFAYNGIISSEYGLQITSSFSEDTSAGASIEILSQEMYRRPKPLLLGVQQKPVLEIPIEINTQYELSAMEDSVISNWLFGNLNYKKLQILQPDMQYIYFNCIFKDKETVRVGNIIRGYKAVISCDSPFAWEYPRQVIKTYGDIEPSVFSSFTINNTSDNADYTYPTITVTANNVGGYISLTNNDDTENGVARRLYITNLPPNEIVTIDNDLQTITASPSGINLLPYFSGYKWVRYVKGKNNFYLTGNVKEITFEHEFARKVS